MAADKCAYISAVLNGLGTISVLEPPNVRNARCIHPAFSRVSQVPPRSAKEKNGQLRFQFPSGNWGLCAGKSVGTALHTSH